MRAVPETLFQSELRSLALIARGKVRDVYAIDAERLLIVTTDRISAFDVVLPDPIPGKGAVLTALSTFWFQRMGDRIANHVLDTPLEDVLGDPAERQQVSGRAMVVRRLLPLPIEAVARGYLVGSGWKDYQATGAVCGVTLPAGLHQAGRLPEPIFTPATKAEAGAHDENISFEAMAQRLGHDTAERVRDVTLAIYRDAADYARQRGILIADTKFEFARLATGELVWIDEALTPDSSRFWPADEYFEGISPPSFDKQFVRDYLETLDWDKAAPGPRLPRGIVDKTAAKYREAQRRLMGA